MPRELRPEFWVATSKTVSRRTGRCSAPRPPPVSLRLKPRKIIYQAVPYAGWLVKYAENRSFTRTIQMRNPNIAAAICLTA